MPTYEYICQKCGHHFDLVQSITANALGTCPKAHCAKARWGRGKVRRALSGGAGLIFKGSGFYSTDYRSESYKAAAKKESGNGSSGGDSKPATTKTDSTGSKSPAPATTK